MLFLGPLWRTLWFLAVGAHGALTFVAIKRGFQREFPIFVCYTSWITLEGVLLIYMDYAPSVSGDQYTAAFSLAAAISVAIRFALIYEIFKHLLSRYPALTRSGISLFRAATLLLLIIVLALAWFAPATGRDPTMARFFVLERTVNILLIGQLLFLFIFSRAFGLSWRSHAFGIALGLGIFATVMLSTSAIRTQTQPTAPNQMTNITEGVNQGTYLFCALLWLVYLLATERPPQTPKPRLPKHDLGAWNQELQRFLNR
jgi:hypothetical protein